MWKLVMRESLYKHLTYQCKDVIIDGHGSWQHSSWKLAVDFRCSLMWHAASVHNNYDINTLTLSPQLQSSFTHEFRRTVIQVPLTTENAFTLLHLQTEKHMWGAEFKRVMWMVQKSWRNKRIKAIQFAALKFDYGYIFQVLNEMTNFNEIYHKSH